MTTLPLTFLLPQALAVALVADVPTLALRIQAPPALAVELVQEVPQLQLQIRQPQALDAALLPILIGPPGPAGSGAGSAPVSRTFTWSGGRLASVTFADGSSKALTWSGDRLTRVDTLRPGLPTQRADLSYNPDGTLAAVAQSEV